MNESRPRKEKNSKKANTASQNPAAASNSSPLTWIVVASIAVVAAALLVNRYAGSFSALERQANFTTTPNTISNKAADVAENGPTQMVIEGVNVHKFMLNETEDGKMEVVGQRSTVDAVKTGEYRSSVDKALDEFVDAHPPVPFEYSTDAHVARVEHACVFLEDHWALSRFMLFPWDTPTLRQSPTIRSLPVDVRKKVYELIFKTVRERLATNYAFHQKSATSFRDMAWSSYFDFEGRTQVSCAKFLGSTPMERALIARDITADSNFFELISICVKNRLFWTFIKDVFVWSDVTMQSGGVV